MLSRESGVSFLTGVASLDRQTRNYYGPKAVQVLAAHRCCYPRGIHFQQLIHIL